MTSTIPINYGAFYDVPRMVEFKFKDTWYFLRSYFNDEKDDYNDYYDVYQLPFADDYVFSNPLYYFDELNKCRHLGQMAVDELGLDPTLRKTVDAHKFEKWLLSQNAR